MQGLGLSDPKERQRYSKSHLNGNVVLHPTAGVRTDLRSEGAARLKSPALARIALIRAGLFAATLAALTGAPAFAALAPVRRHPKNARQLRQAHHQWRTCQTRPNRQLNDSGCVEYKKAAYRQSCGLVGIRFDLTDTLLPSSRACTLTVAVCLMGSFLPITPRGGPIENFRQETHLERLASIDDRPRGHTMFACDNADRSLKFAEKSVVRLLIVSRHHRCACDSPSLRGRYPAGPSATLYAAIRALGAAVSSSVRGGNIDRFHATLKANRGPSSVCPTSTATGVIDRPFRQIGVGAALLGHWLA